MRILEARGAFSVRHGVETVASALGVSRFTVYNYLNRDSSPAKGSTPPKGSNPPKGSGLPEGAEKNSQS